MTDTGWKAFYKKHSSVSLLLFIVSMLCIGVVEHTGFKHMPKMLLVAGSILVFYIALYKLHAVAFIDKAAFRFSFKQLNALALYFPFAICMLLFIVEIVHMKGLYGLQLFSIHTTREYSALRSGIYNDASPTFIYLSQFLLKAFFPFAILHYLLLDKKIFYFILLLLGAVAAFNMLEKSYILAILIPAMTYCIYYRKYLHVLLHFALIVAVIFTLTAPGLVNNDNVKPKKEVDFSNQGFVSRQVATAKGIAHRIFILPGNMVSHWFESIPGKLPYLHGDNYPLIARLKGHAPAPNYNTEVYKVIFPEYVAQGIVGSANAASFTREYANFGTPGLVLSGFLLALACLILNAVFRQDVLLFHCLNLFPLLLLSSGSIFTQLFSGGWALIILLYLLYRDIYNRIPHEN